MRNKLKEAERVVIKVGTSTLIYPNGNINLQAIDQLAFVLSDLVNQGKEIMLVSSGAIGVGLNKLNYQKRPSSIPAQQAVASIGQSELMTIYAQRFQTYNQLIGQVLLTRDVIDFPTSRNNVVNTLEQLLKMNIIPIINENDSVSVDELDHLTKFGDNDLLSAIVAQLTGTDLLVMLSDIDGFYSDNPFTNPKAKLYSHVSTIDSTSYQQAAESTSKYGTGGMTSKLTAAKAMLAHNNSMVLANGKDPRIIFDVLNGLEVGTLFTNDLQKGT